jgi:hypothetical protein
MKRLAFVTLLSAFTLIIFSCKSIISPPDKDKNDPAPEYYINYKISGTAITQTEVSGVRGTSDTPRILTVLGSSKNETNPKFKFSTTESFIGFVAGLNVGCNAVSGAAGYIEYINEAGKIYTTLSDTQGISVFLTEVSYTKDGIVKGTFNGRIKDETGNTINITDGEFRVKFSN